MAKAGRKRDVVREALYWQLLSTGMGTVQASRETGIGRRTGLRWRIDAERQAREHADEQRWRGGGGATRRSTWWLLRLIPI